MQKKKIRLNIMPILEEEGLTVEDASKIMQIPKHKVLDWGRGSYEALSIVGFYRLCKHLRRDYNEFFAEQYGDEEGL